ncbi:ribosomal n-lysine methyltransferase [Pelomyxa schiedti]|nr:ribosomal n-lysine methyltransferase [Pelomyxa schiedti]
MIATKNIAAKSVLVRVPEALLLSATSVLTCSDLSELWHSCASTLNINQLLSAFLIYQKHLGARSQWNIYLRSLPQSFNTRIDFSEADQSLFPTQFQCQLSEFRETMMKDYTQLSKILEGHATTFTVSLEEYKWALNVVQTRSCHFRSVIKSKSDDCCIVPFADFLNHSDSVQTEGGFNEKTGYYEITTVTSFKAGEQVFISYGGHDNRTLISLYGFLLPKNAHDKVCLDDGISQNTLRFYAEPRKRRILRDFFGIKELRGFFVYAGGSIPWLVHSYLHVIHMSKAELDRNAHLSLLEKDFDTPTETTHQSEEQSYSINASKSLRAVLLTTLRQLNTFKENAQRALCTTSTTTGGNGVHSWAADLAFTLANEECAIVEAALGTLH